MKSKFPIFWEKILLHKHYVLITKMPHSIILFIRNYCNITTYELTTLDPLVFEEVFVVVFCLFVYICSQIALLFYNLETMER